MANSSASYSSAVGASTSNAYTAACSQQPSTSGAMATSSSPVSSTSRTSSTDTTSSSRLSSSSSGAQTASSSTPNASSSSLPSSSGDYTWKPVRIGGGGFVTGVVVHPGVDDLVYARTDVGGAYKWNPGSAQWVQLITVDRMPQALLNIQGGNPGVRRTNAYAVESIAIDPSDPEVLFIACGNDGEEAGFLLKSTNGGGTFTLTHLAVPMAGNDEYRTSAERLAVQPNNSNIVLFGSRTSGLWRSTNGGVDWTQISTSEIPFGSKVDGTDVGVVGVVFDAQTPSRVYASVGGEGIYRSDDAGVTWSQILGQWATELEVSGGVLYAAGQAAGLGVRRYTPAGGWTNVTPYDDTDIDELAVDPSNAQRLFAVNGNGFQRFYRSTNGGSSWTELDTNSSEGQANFRSTQIPWVESSDVRNWLSVGALTLDPRNANRVWFAEGMGMWRCTNATDSNNAPVFDNISQGIEEMVATDIVALPGGHTVKTTWDRMGFHHTDPDAFPSSQLGLTDSFTSGWSLATTVANPNFVAAVVSDHRFCCGDNVYAGYSENSGQSWTRFPANASGVNNPADLRFGELVVSASSTQNMVWLPRYGAQNLYYTINSGSSWQRASISLDDWNGYFFGNRKRLAADGSVGGMFYIYRWTDGSVYASTNQGQTFTDAGGRLPSYTYWSQLKGAPGRAGHLWFAAGFDQMAGSNGLYRSTDGAGSFTQITAVEEAWAVGFGRPSSEGSYPTVFIYGLVNGQWGVYRSTDEGANWVRIATHPLGLFDKVVAVTGDPDVFGKVYIGWSGNSFAYGVPAGAP